MPVDTPAAGDVLTRTAMYYKLMIQLFLSSECGIGCLRYLEKPSWHYVPLSPGLIVWRTLHLKPRPLKRGPVRMEMSGRGGEKAQASFFLLIIETLTFIHSQFFAGTNENAAGWGGRAQVAVSNIGNYSGKSTTQFHKPTQQEKKITVCQGAAYEARPSFAGLQVFSVEVADPKFLKR